METGLASGILTSLPGRYAKALFDLAQEMADGNSVAASMKALQKVIQSSTTLAQAMGNPTFSRLDQASALKEVCIHIKAPVLLQQFVGYLAKAGRMGCFFKIVEIFQGLVSENAGEKRIEVMTAHSLTLPQRHQLKDKMQQALKSPLHVTYTRDPGLLGGVKVKMGYQVIDATLATHIKELAKAMKGNL